MLIAPKSRHDVAERSVVDVQRPRPGDEAGPDLELTMKNGGIDDGRQQVVRRLDGVDVAGEVQVDLLHRHDLGKAAAGAAALDAKERTGRRLPEAERNVGADSSEALRQADGARRLPLPRPRRR